AAIAEGRPDQRRADAVDAPLDRVDARLILPLQVDREWDRHIRKDLLDLRPGRQLVDRGAVGRDFDRVGDPEGLVGLPTALEQAADARLARVGLLLQAVDDEAPAG